MRAAPPVSVRCSGGWWWRSLQTFLPTLATAACGAWVLQWAQQSVAWVTAPATVVALLAWHLSAPVLVDLVWDGQCWKADGVPGSLDVMLDLGTALLLRLRPESRRRQRWIAVTATEAGPAMHGLRVAAYHRPPEPTAQAEPARPAKSHGPAGR